MSNLTAVVTGVALAAVLVAVVSVRRDEAQPSKPAAIAFEARLEMDMPVMPKADRLPLAVPEPEPVLPPRKVDPVPIAAVAQLKPPADPVCGARGRTYYTKGNGWRYWKCVR